MFDFLKKLFPKEEPLVEERIKVESLSTWLNEKISKIDFQEDINSLLNTIKDKKWLLEEKLDVLSKAEMEQKENVDEKIKNVVLGHKENYIKFMRQFAENLIIPQEVGLAETMEFITDLNASLDDLAKKTAKSYQAAQHLFFRPVEDTFKVVGEINLLVKKFNERLDKKDLSKIDLIKEKVRKIEDILKKKEFLRKEISWKEDKFNRCQAGKEKQEQEVSKLISSKEYSDFKELKEKESKIKNLVDDDNNEIFLFFSKIDKSMRKYERITMEVNLVQAYLGDSVKAFLADDGLKIMGVLEGLGRTVEKGEIDLDDKQKLNVSELVNKAKQGYLMELRSRSKEVGASLEQVKAKLRRYNIDKLIEEAEYKKEHFAEQSVLVKREAEELKVKWNNLDEKKLKEDFVNLSKSVFKVNVVLSS